MFLKESTEVSSELRVKVIKHLFKSLTHSVESHVYLDLLYRPVITTLQHYKCIHLSTLPAVLFDEKYKPKKKAKIGKV